MKTLIYALITLLSTKISAERLLFKKASKCPVTAAGLESVTLSDQFQCSLKCALRPRCNAFHYQTLTGLCFLGDACNSAAQWADGTCDSFVHVASDTTCGSSSTGESDLLSQLQMKLFYRFKQSGLVNEVNPRHSCLTAHNVTIGSDGAKFNGNSGSYLSTETPGFEQFLDYGKSYSFFARVRHVMNNGFQFYHRFQKCNDSDSTGAGNTFAKNLNFVYNIAQWTSQSVQSLSAESAGVVPSDGREYQVSVGVTFNTTVQQNFYFNGSLVLASVFKFGDSGSITADRFHCLMLGRSTIDAYCLLGTVQCYGMSSKLLSLANFQQLDSLCN